MQIRDAGVWKPSQPWVRDAGVWKPVQKAWVRDAGVWKEFYSAFALPNVGDAWEGGYYAGLISVDSDVYAIVVAPKDLGQSSTALSWRTTDTALITTGNDGWSNTQSMISSGISSFPAANFCVSLSISGFTDWYLPSMNELIVIYRSFKPTTASNYAGSGNNPDSIPPTGTYTSGNPSQTELTQFRTGGGEDFAAAYYWSSSGYSGLSIAQRFSDGNNNRNYNNYGTRTAAHNVRAVRRVLVPPSEIL